MPILEGGGGRTLLMCLHMSVAAQPVFDDPLLLYCTCRARKSGATGATHASWRSSRKGYLRHSGG
eukprot:1158313-Pelagomonas_calceolata.AAC.12